MQGFNQIKGLDYKDTFAPTGKPSTLGLLLLYALKSKKPIQKFDVKSAFLHSPIDKEVIIRTPKGSKGTSQYLSLKKTLYGLKQAPKNWYNTLTAWFKEVGFKESSCNMFQYLSRNEVSDDKILLSQPKHVELGLKKLGLEDTRTSKSPLTQNLQLKQATDEEFEQFKALNVNYQSEIGLLNNIACYSRPDISFAVSSLSRFNVKPGLPHSNKVKKTWK